MTDITSDGQERIQSNDGTVKIGITDKQMRITQPGVAAADATDQDTIMNENNNSFKIVFSGTTSLSYDGDVGTFLTLPHGLGYIPIVMAYVQFPNDPVNFTPMHNQYVPMPVYMDRAGLPFVQCTQSADATNIYLRVHDIYATGVAPQFYNFRYYALQETAS